MRILFTLLILICMCGGIAVCISKISIRRQGRSIDAKVQLRKRCAGRNHCMLASVVNEQIMELVGSYQDCRSQQRNARGCKRSLYCVLWSASACYQVCNSNKSIILQLRIFYTQLCHVRSYLVVDAFCAASVATNCSPGLTSLKCSSLGVTRSAPEVASRHTDSASGAVL